MKTNEKEMMKMKSAAAERKNHEEENAGTENGQAAGSRKYRDGSSKTIFEDPVLCAQFLRDYVDIPMLKDVKPEDIEDVTERFVHLFTEERNSDVVKKVHLKNKENNLFYLISLIEHKSDIDYNVVMQVFRYITFIWEDYEKEQERLHTGISKTKGFRYPAVLPIVFYDGIDNWTAAISLHERVLFSDILGKYIPDYQCILIQLKDYSNAELMEKKDELALLMMIDKLHNATDYENMGKEVSGTFLKEATENSPEYLLKLMSEVIGMFLSKLNIPQEEADTFTDQVKERKMGELFKHFEGWDVQALRQEIKEAKDETVRVREEAKRKTEEAKRKTEEAKKETEKAKKETEKVAYKLRNIVEKYHIPEEEIDRILMAED